MQAARLRAHARAPKHQNRVWGVLASCGSACDAHPCSARSVGNPHAPCACVHTHACTTTSVGRSHTPRPCVRMHTHATCLCTHAHPCTAIRSGGLLPSRARLPVSSACGHEEERVCRSCRKLRIGAQAATMHYLQAQAAHALHAERASLIPYKRSCVSVCVHVCVCVCSCVCVSVPVCACTPACKLARVHAAAAPAAAAAAAAMCLTGCRRALVRSVACCRRLGQPLLLLLLSLCQVGDRFHGRPGDACGHARQQRGRAAGQPWSMSVRTGKGPKLTVKDVVHGQLHNARGCAGQQRGCVAGQPWSMSVRRQVKAKASKEGTGQGGGGDTDLF